MDEKIAKEMVNVPAPPHEEKLLSTTTAEQDRTTASQRQTSLIWETTQQKIALMVIGASLLVALIISIFGRTIGPPDLQLASLVFIYGVANLVTGFYFGRTNHTKVGGVGGSTEGKER